MNISSSVFQRVVLLFQTRLPKGWGSSLDTVSFLLFFFALLYSVTGIHGFMRGHMGWLGPDLYSVAINLDASHFFMARGLMSDGSYMAYNHQPPAIFYFFNAVSHLGKDLFDKLQIAYFMSAGVLILGWYAMARVFRKLGYDPAVANFTVIVLGSTSFFTFYRALLSFDNFSVLVSAGLIYAFAIFEGRHGATAAPNSIQSRIVATGICIASLLVSWYVYPIIGFFLLGMFIFRVVKRQDWKTPFVAGFLVFVTMLALVASLFYMNHRYMGNYQDIWDFLGGDAATNAKDLGVRYKPFLELMKALYAQFSMLFPNRAAKFALLILLLSGVGAVSIKKIRSLVSFDQTMRMPVLSILALLLGASSFLYLTRYWSWIHPFGFPFLLMGFGIILVWALSKLPAEIRQFLPLLTFVLSFHAAQILQNEREGDVWRAKETQSLIDVVQTEFPRGYALTLNTGCGIFNQGMFTYIAAYPNSFLSPNEKDVPSDKAVEVLCENNDTGETVLRTKDGKRKYKILPFTIGYEKIR